MLQWRCRGSHRLVWAAAGGLAAAAMGGYVLTRTVGGFLGDHGDVGNWRCPLGLAALRAVTIDPAGQVAGTLATGQPFTTTIPVALDDRVLAGRLAAHHVQVTATGARDLLTSHTDALNQLTAALLEHETISGDQVRALVHPARPAPPACRARPAAAVSASERNDRSPSSGSSLARPRRLDRHR